MARSLILRFYSVYFYILISLLFISFIYICREITSQFYDSVFSIRIWSVLSPCSEFWIYGLRLSVLSSPFIDDRDLLKYIHPGNQLIPMQTLTLPQII